MDLDEVDSCPEGDRRTISRRKLVLGAKLAAGDTVG